MIGINRGLSSCIFTFCFSILSLRLKFLAHWKQRHIEKSPCFKICFWYFDFRDITRNLFFLNSQIFIPLIIFSRRFVRSSHNFFFYFPLIPLQPSEFLLSTILPLSSPLDLIRRNEITYTLSFFTFTLII